PNVGSIHAPLPAPHCPWLVSRIVCSSAMVDNRQSQWLLHPPVWVLPSPLVQLPTPVAPPFSVARKLVKAVPSGAVPLLLQMYVSFTQCRQLLPATFCSHWSPVWLSVTVPSPLSTNRSVVVVVLLVVLLVVVLVLVVVVLVVVVGVPHTWAVHIPLQQLWFVLQRAPSALQRRWAVTSRGTPSVSIRAASMAGSSPRVRGEICDLPLRIRRSGVRITMGALEVPLAHTRERVAPRGLLHSGAGVAARRRAPGARPPRPVSHVGSRGGGRR